jgi:hypothetical protein
MIIPTNKTVGMNLCRPDDRKSCAACCGLYNVSEGTRPALSKNLQTRTTFFRQTERSAEALQNFESVIRESGAVCGLDDAIHVCEFTGFLDEALGIVGCMLHPSSPGNRGIDLRGLCHYGSMACKTFFCPAWEEIDLRHRGILVDTIDDWHLYGLVITDVDFVGSLFGLIEERLGELLDPERLSSGPALGIFKQMLSWKDSWPFSHSSSIRKSRYYFKRSGLPHGHGHEAHCARLLDAIRFTFGIEDEMAGAEPFLRKRVEYFVSAYTNGFTG